MTTQKTALIVRHVPYEDLAGFHDPIATAGYTLERIDVRDPGYASIDLGEPDLLIVMGGPMGVYEESEHPWIRWQLQRLARRLDAGRPTLGVCLGAQMLAAALGGEVFAGPAFEIGFGPVTILDTTGPLRHLVGVPMLHWHGDTFTLPGDVELLASTPLYPHQAFRRGSNILALQFHPEMGQDPRFETWLEHSPEAVAKAGGAEKLRTDHNRLGPGAVAAGQAMLTEWLVGLA